MDQQFKTKRDVIRYIILDTRSYGVGYVISNDNSNTINDGNNTALITLLQTPAQKSAPKYDYPDGRVLDCGCTVYYKSEIMNTAHGTSCADHYDSMEGEDD